MTHPHPSRIPHDDLLSLRDQFPILGTSTYLNSCSLGPLSHRAEAELADFLDHWHRLGASAWYEHWVGKLADLRTAVGAFTGCSGEEIALLPSTSAALAVVSECVDYSTRNRVVISELDFPTLAYQWAVKPGVEVVVVRSRDGVGIDPEQYREVVDERTAFLATSHVFYATGYRQDLDALAAVAHDAGALCLIDGYHGVGQVATNLGSTKVDFYTTGPLKWLLGGPGLSYLWASERMIATMEPRITSWWAHRRQFAFELEGFEYHDDARRFEMGTPALPTVHTALAGQQIMNEVGARRVEERNAGLTSYLVDALRGAGFSLTISDDPAHRTAIVMVQHPNPPEAVRYLADHSVTVDHRPGHVRVSPHFYNTVEEMDRFVEVLAAFSG